MHADLPASRPADRPLAGLLEEPPDRDRVVAFDASGDAVTHATFLEDVFSLAADRATDRGKRWLVETEDACEIAVCLLAAAVVGARIALPPNLQPGTLAGLRSQSDRVFGPRRHDGDRMSARGVAARPALHIDRTAPLVDLFTSGTSGPGKRITKSLCHLEDEVIELEKLFGGAIAKNACVFATVPAHHLYGLLFRVLWPLASSRPLCRDASLLPDDLLGRIARKPAAVVVSSPAHLRHLAGSARIADQASRIAAVFSSGGPLETATALALEEVAGAAPAEIFGSTETGGVAARRASRMDPSPMWSPFPSVRVAVDPTDGALVVTSPFVTPPGSRTFEPLQTMRMGDRAELCGSGFRLAGRIDRIAKVAEKSLSLPEIEACLAAHELVDSAAVATWRGRGGPRLGALVVLTAHGRRRLAELGRRALAGILAGSLAERWDRVALPRRWRFVDALPVDDRGKLAHHAIEAELERAVEQPCEPLLLAEHHDGGEHVYELVVPRDLAYLDGHYDAFPLVPGVVQIHWVMLALGRILEREGPGHADCVAERMEAVKFRNVLRPAQHFTMRLFVESMCESTREITGDGTRESTETIRDSTRESLGGSTRTRVAFTLAHRTRVFSSGRVTLRG